MLLLELGNWIVLLDFLLLACDGKGTILLVKRVYENSLFFVTPCMPVPLTFP